MISRPIGNTDFVFGPINLRSGERITIKALRPLGKSTWQVSIRGKLFTVTTKIKLSEGKNYTGRIFRHGNTLVFSTKSDVPRGIASEIPLAVSPERRVMEIMRQLHMPIRTETVEWIICKAGMKKDDLKLLRLIAQLHDKGLSVEDPEEILDTTYIFKKGHQHHSGQQGRQGANEPFHDDNKDELKSRIKERLKERMLKTGESPLALFNQIRSRHDNWIVIPIGLTIQGTSIDGTLRCKLDDGEKKITAFTVVLNVQGEDMWFSVPNWGHYRPTIKICDNFKNDTAFFEKLTKLGLKIDDTINKEKRHKDFDGFEELANRGFKTVDTVV